ncbi:hypothetical protein J2Z83_000096 [Virgibacillus natechei]|uniref:Uncharacterized protein n=1 Tax=Virgibacillus natechei TaxID=1216297 RepID=A0ABS4ID76_9BACI|nr:hypothetical protein [Virgibacillus natechei]MBP1968004.1 hypothetical protein [Virgibacillus natechei]UZD14713.1 hypothetical protein OLD84_09520 [Virgibacillus natechei]
MDILKKRLDVILAVIVVVGICIGLLISAIQEDMEVASNEEPEIVGDESVVEAGKRESIPISLEDFLYEYTLIAINKNMTYPDTDSDKTHISSANTTLYVEGESDEATIMISFEDDDSYTVNSITCFDCTQEYRKAINDSLEINGLEVDEDYNIGYKKETKSLLIRGI